MLLTRTKICPVSFPSVGTFIKHLPINLITIFNPIKRSPKHVTTVAVTSLKGTHFENLKPHQKHQLHLYVDSLLQWNQKMNLTAVKDADGVMERHIDDSLAIIDPLKSSYLAHCGDSCEKLSMVDVGSGAGLPGLVLAIACPGWKVTLLESMSKRCTFLEHVVGLSGLSNVQVIRDRAENFGQNVEFREVFDVAVARAVAEMRILAEYCLPLLRVGGLFVAAKGHDPQDEVRQAEKAIRMMGAAVLQTCPVESHSKYGQRTVVVCLKDAPTPRKYPRDPGTPAKSPL